MGKQRGRNVRRTHRVFIQHHGAGPWNCYSCSELVLIIGQGTRDGNVHHLDEDVTNDDITNLVMMHSACHQRLHGSPTIEQRAQISAKLQGRPSPTRGMKFPNRKPVDVSGKLNPFYGKHHTSDALLKMRQPRRRVRCEVCDNEYALNWITRHAKEGKCIAL